MNEVKRPLKVFLCHAHTDKRRVHELYHRLKRRGIQAWLDEEDLIGGQDWQVEISKAIAKADAILVCLTKSSVDAEGFVQKEIKYAIDKALEIPDGRIFLIPIRLEDSELPFSLNKYQAVDLYEKEGFSRLMRALNLRASQLERAEVELTQPKSDTAREGENRPTNQSANLKGIGSTISTFIESNLSKAFPALKGAGFIGIGIALVWIVSWGIPKLPSFFPTASPTATITFTSTEHPTATRTFVPTSTKTKAPTGTATIISTNTPTRTPTKTPTPTSTQTSTFTPTSLPKVYADIKSVRSDYPLGVQIKFLSEQSTVTSQDGTRSFCYRAGTCTYEWKLFSATGALVDLDENAIYVFTFDTPGNYSLSLKVCYQKTDSCDTDTLLFKVDK